MHVPADVAKGTKCTHHSASIGFLLHVEPSPGACFADVYRRDVRTKLDTATDLAAKDNTRFGALLIEPVVQGAGGMLMIDPLYQRVLMQECKSRSIPVILDEVIVDRWRRDTGYKTPTL